MPPPGFGPNLLPKQKTKEQKEKSLALITENHLSIPAVQEGL